MNEPFSPIKYLRQELDIDNDFLSEWRRLTLQEKEELKEYATEEYNNKKKEDK
tara:strand:+ start:1180 stop:1338 length:159 start_codon:yes stop_codon:yes gene_type:complete